MNALPIGRWRKATNRRGVEVWLVFVAGEKIADGSRVEIRKASGDSEVRAIHSHANACECANGGHLYALPRPPKASRALSFCSR